MSASFVTFETCLAWAVNRWPEESWAMLSPTSVSLDKSLPFHHPKSWAGKVFADFQGDPREFDRAALGLLCLWTLWREKSLGSLGAGDVPAWREALVKTLSMPGGFESLVYAILFNNLGKIDSTAVALSGAGDEPAPDHDRVLALSLRCAAKEVAPGFARLPKPWAERWLAGLDSGFNLEMAVRMELPREAWVKLLALDKNQRDFHALRSYFDLLGRGGALDPSAPAPAVASRLASETFALACFGEGPEQFESELMVRRGWACSWRPAMALACMAGSSAVGAPARVKVLLDPIGSSAVEAFDWALGPQARVVWQYATAMLLAGGTQGLAALSGDEGAQALSVLSISMAKLRVTIGEKGAVPSKPGEVVTANLREMAALRRAADPRWAQPGTWRLMSGGWSWRPAA